MFILGVVLGFGLSQMLQSINKFRQVRRNNRLIKEQQAFNVRVAQAVALANSWGTVETGIGQTAEQAQRQRPSGPAGW